MKMKIILPLLAFAVLFGCSKPKNEQSTTNTAPMDNSGNQNQNSAAPEVKTGDNNFTSTGKNSNESGIRNSSEGMRVKFPAGTTKVTLNGSINGFGQQITYVFEASQGQKLTAFVKPQTSGGNIRIAQIISPGGNADGPFGDQVIYTLKQSGDWKLVLSENMMAGDPWKGEYSLSIEIK